MSNTGSDKNTGEKRRSLWWRFANRPDFSSIVAVTLLILFFSLFTDSFLTKANVFGLLRNGALYIFIAVGQAVVLVVGGMNISVGATGALATVLCGYMFQNLGFSTWLTVALTLIVGALLGIFNGLIITKIHINPFVTTLSTMYVFQGIANGISKGYPYTDIPQAFTKLGRGSIGGLIPYLFVVVVILLILLHLFYKYTVLGRHMLATGGNAEAAQMMGVRTNLIYIIANAASTMFASLAALLWISRLGSATAATGSDWMLISNAVAIIGGTALSGGVISPFGILCSGILLAIIKNGLIMIGVDVYFEQTFIGTIILIAVAIESIRTRVSYSA